MSIIIIINICIDFKKLCKTLIKHFNEISLINDLLFLHLHNYLLFAKYNFFILNHKTVLFQYYLHTIISINILNNILFVINISFFFFIYISKFSFSFISVQATFKIFILKNLNTFYFISFKLMKHF